MIILKATLLVFGCPVGELPDAHLVIPFAPVRDHGAVPGGSGRDNRHYDASGHEQFSGIGDNAVLRPFAVAEEVRRVGQHETHRARRAGGTLEGAGKDGGVRQALPCNIGAVGANLHAVESGCGKSLAGCQQITLACCGIEDCDCSPAGKVSRWCTIHSAKSGGVRMKAEVLRLAKVPCAMESGPPLRKNKRTPHQRLAVFSVPAHGNAHSDPQVGSYTTEQG